jgi:hypothetical protein
LYFGIQLDQYIVQQEPPSFDFLSSTTKESNCSGFAYNCIELLLYHSSSLSSISVG